MMRAIARHERWSMDTPFVIANYRYDYADLVVVELTLDGAIGRGEACPTAFYGETVASVLQQAHEIFAELHRTPWEALHDLVPPGSARNAIDCAMWDLRAKSSGTPAWTLAGLDVPPSPVETATTLSIAEPALMAQRAIASSHRILKVKVGSEGALGCVEAVRRARPDAKIVVDANQAWSPMVLERLMPAMSELGVAMIEQPLPAGADKVLGAIERLIPICADESCHTVDDLDNLAGRYDVVNVKLDKTGGLTAALALCGEARRRGFGLMIGCMEATSLSMAPALLLTPGADLVDLDGPLLLSTDRPHPLRYANGWVHPSGPALWG